MIYEIIRWSRDLDSDFTLKDCLFGAVKLNKYFDSDKYFHAGCGTGFDQRLFLSS